MRVTLRVKPIPRAHRAVYRRRGLRPPAASSSREWAALWPYRPRFLHERYARSRGFFWLPCPLCKAPFGGHEIVDSIPDPTDEAGTLWMMICPRCTASRNGGRP